MSTFLTPSNRPFELGGSILVSRLEAIKQYCQTLPFDHQSSWADVMFADGVTPQALAQQFSEQRGELAPHQALLLAFLQAMEVPQALFNDLPKRHRELFYRDHLRFRERPAQPDHVSVAFTPQPSVNELTLPAGLLLDGGTDTQGRPRRYQLQQPLSINQGKLTDVRWVRQGEGLPRSFIAYDAKTQAQWPAHGVALIAPDALDQVMSKALLIMDERLRLSSGMRFVSLQFDAPLIPLSAHISVDGKWQEMTVLVRDQRVTLSVAADAPPFTSALGLDGMTSDLPVLKITYCGHGVVPRVRDMQVFVQDSRAARVHTADGWLSNGEACCPFGVQSQRQSRFTIVSDEWQALNGVTVTLTPHWQSLPDQALCVELSRANSLPSMHELFQVSNTGVQAQSIKFQLKDEDLAQRTVVLDFTLLQADAASHELQREDTPQIEQPLLWQRLQINWRSDPFPVAQQYLQHPFGYGVRPWSAFELVQEPAQLVQQLMQEPATLAKLAQELALEQQKLAQFDQHARWTKIAQALATKAQSMAQGLQSMGPYLQNIEWNAQQLEQVVQGLEGLELSEQLNTLNPMVQELLQQAQQEQELVGLAQLTLKLLHRVRVTLTLVQQWVSLVQVFNAQMLFSNFVSEEDVRSWLLQILGIGREITLGQMYKRGLSPSVLVKIIFNQEIVQRQEGQEDKRSPTLEELAEELAQESLETPFWDLVSDITVAQMAELPFSQEGHTSLLAFVELIIANAEADLDPMQEYFQVLFTTRLGGVAQKMFEHIGQRGRDAPLQYALRLQWFLRTMGRTDVHTLYLGLSDLKVGQTRAFGLSVKDAESRVVQWSYLASDGWRPLELDLDPTAQLVRSGLMPYTLPMDAANQTTLMPKGRHWLKARVATRADSQPTQLLSFETNCANALLVDAPAVAADHFQTPLPAGTITHTVETVPGLASVKQPWPSSGGRGPESADAFDQRIAQQMGHRGRAVTWKDIENLLKELFPDVHSVKLPDPGASGARPSKKIVVVPAHGHADNADQLRPQFSAQRLKEMSGRLQSLASPWLQVRLINPQYQDVDVHYQVSFAPGFSAHQGNLLLRQALERRYMPWFQSDRAEVTLEQELSYYDMVDFIQGQDFVERVVDLTFNGKRESLPCAADTVLILQLSGGPIQAASTQIHSEKMA